GTLDELHYAWKERGPARLRQGREERGLSFGDPLYTRRISLAPGRFQKRAGTGAFIHAEVGATVLLFREGQSVFGQRLLEGEEMGWLVVGNHPVEVEDDRPQSWNGHGLMRRKRQGLAAQGPA